MTAHASRSRVPSRRAAHEPPDAQLGLRCWRPTSRAVVIRVGGDLDCRTAARLHELLAALFSSMVDTVVLDLSGLDFIGVAGLELLLHGHRQADSRGIGLRLVTGAHCLERALIAAELTEAFRCFPTLERALATVAGRVRDLHAAN